jgi:hypothetical protein
MVDLEARRRIQALEAQGVQRDREITRLSGRLSRLAATLEAVHAPARPIDSPAVPPNPPMPKPAVPQAPAPFASRIVGEFPALFTEFRGKRFSLLWRGSRDGFRARDFHGRCDGHANTLTFIEDTWGNIFGGFTPLAWESREYDRTVGGANCLKADPSLGSFLFTLKNPHKVPARKFALKADEQEEAIRCDASWGPHFYDIGVSDLCNATTKSFTSDFGLSYANDTGLEGETFFTGSQSFTVKEIEVFEITD